MQWNVDGTSFTDLQFTCSGGWTDGCISSIDYYAIDFWIWSDVTDPEIIVGVINYDAVALTTVAAGSAYLFSYQYIPANTWVHLTIPFSDILKGPAEGLTNFYGLQFAVGMDYPTNTIVLDSIVLLAPGTQNPCVTAPTFPPTNPPTDPPTFPPTDPPTFPPTDPPTFPPTDPPPTNPPDIPPRDCPFYNPPSPVQAIFTDDWDPMFYLDRSYNITVPDNSNAKCGSSSFRMGQGIQPYYQYAGIACQGAYDSGCGYTCFDFTVTPILDFWVYSSVAYPPFYIDLPGSTTVSFGQLIASANTWTHVSYPVPNYMYSTGLMFFDEILFMYEGSPGVPYPDEIYFDSVYLLAEGQSNPCQDAGAAQATTAAVVYPGGAPPATGPGRCPAFTNSAFNYYPCASTSTYTRNTTGFCGCGSTGNQPWAGTPHEWPQYFTAAGSASVYGEVYGCGEKCGKCYELTPSGDCLDGATNCAVNQNPITVMLTDFCDGNSPAGSGWCDNGDGINSHGYLIHFNIEDTPAFQALGWNNPVITYREVPCGGGGSPPVSEYKENCWCNFEN